MSYAKLLAPCEEYAVFHAACIRADKLCPGGLVRYSSQCQGSADAIDVVCTSITEIRHGLGSRLSLPQSLHWEFKLTALSTLRMLAAFGRLYPNEVVRFAVPENNTISCLPEWNLLFYFDLVQQNNWTEHFLQIVTASFRTFGTVFFNEFLNNLVLRTIDETSLRIITDVLEYLFLVNCPYFCTDEQVFCCKENSGTVEWNAIDKLLSCLQSTLEHQPSTVDFRLILSLINVLASIVGAGYYLVGDCSCIDVSNPLSIFELQHNGVTDHSSASSHDKNRGDVADLLLEYELIKLPLVTIHSRIDLVNVAAVAGKLAKIARHLCLKCDLGILVCLLTGVGEWSPNGCLRYLHPSVRSAIYREIFIHASKEIALSDFDSDQLDIQQLLEVLKPMTDCSAAFMCHCELKRCEPIQQFQRAIFIINERLEGYESCCDWLLKTGCPENNSAERWSDCLINNAELFGSLVNGTVRLLLTFQKNRHLINHDEANRLQTAILRVYASKSIKQQNEVLQSVYVTPTSPSDLCLSVDPELFSSQLLTTLNRVTSDSADLQVVVKDVCLLALLQHSQIIDKLVECAVHNKGQIECVIQIFRFVPALVFIRDTLNQLIVLSSLERRISSASLREAQNIVNFSRLLIVPGMENSGLCDVDNQQLLQPPLCLAQDYLNVCLFPNLSRLLNFVDVRDCLLAADKILPLLAVAVESFDSLTWSELVLCEPIPLLFFLCQVIDICWSESLSGSVEILNMKDMAVGVLNNLVVAVAKYKHSISESSISWLQQQLAFCYWTVKFYAKDLSAELCPLMALHSRSSFLELIDNDRVFNKCDGLLALAEFASISDESLEMLTDSLLLEVSNTEHNLYTRLTNVMSQAMTWCSSREFTRVTRLTSRLIRLHHAEIYNGLLSHSREVEINDTPLNSLIKLDSTVGTSYLVTDSVVALSRLFDERINDPHQCHIARCCVAAFKASLRDCNLRDGTVFVLIGCLLRIFDVITSQVAIDTLSPFALELLSSLEQSFSREHCDSKLYSRLKRVAEAVAEMSRTRNCLSTVVTKVDQILSCSSGR